MYNTDMDDIVITAGDLYTEIDILACALSYKELLSLQGVSSRVVLPGPFNKSITSEIRRWPLDYEKSPGDVSESSFVIVDISEPAHITSFVDQEKIIALFDHHFGFENYWHEKYGDRAIVEKVGACATLIWEEYVKAEADDKISHLSANLISSAIISNTLNFKASVTSQRDIKTYEQLKKYSSLPENWVQLYFQDQEKFAMENPYQAVKEDTIIITTNLSYKLAIGQLELWDSREFFRKNLDDAVKAIKSYESDHWFLTSPSISEGKNYIYTESPEVKDLLSKVLKVAFEDNLAITDKLVLRKEIKKLLLEI